MNDILQLRYLESQAGLVLNKTVGHCLGICWQAAVIGVSVQTVMTSWAELTRGQIHDYMAHLQSREGSLLVSQCIYSKPPLFNTPDWESDTQTLWRKLWVWSAAVVHDVIGGLKTCLFREYKKYLSTPWIKRWDTRPLVPSNLDTLFVGLNNNSIPNSI